MKARIALYGWRRWPDWKPTALLDREAVKDADYVRLTEFVEVDFPELSADDARVEKIAVLETERAHVVDRFSKELKSLDDSLRELRALPAPAAPPLSASPEQREESPAFN
jgi:hypothetical protein